MRGINRRCCMNDEAGALMVLSFWLCLIYLSSVCLCLLFWSVCLPVSFCLSLSLCISFPLDAARSTSPIPLLAFILHRLPPNVDIFRLAPHLGVCFGWLRTLVFFRLAQKLDHFSWLRILIFFCSLQILTLSVGSESRSLCGWPRNLI